MTRAEQLKHIVNLFDLNRHPFYQAWRAGKITTNQLSCYASEFEGLVAWVAEAWDRLGETVYAAEERDHHRMWGDFKIALGATHSESLLSETRTLNHLCERSLDHPAETLGALYAFEAQQPATSESKLQGLREHYSLPPSAETYFAEHAGKWHELDVLDQHLDNLTEQEFEMTKQSCAVTCAALWLGLDGVMTKH
jgi:pyrroloquinoline-quinone synthase